MKIDLIYVRADSTKAPQFTRKENIDLTQAD